MAERPLPGDRGPPTDAMVTFQGSSGAVDYRRLPITSGVNFDDSVAIGLTPDSAG